MICADDTDVFILCLAFRCNTHASLFQKCGTRTRTRFIDISNVAASVGPDVCKALLGMHAFTGCDTVMAFAGKGKTRAMTILKANVEFKEAFAQLGVQCFVSGVVARRPVPRRGFRGKCCLSTALHRLCGQWSDKLSG